MRFGQAKLKKEKRTAFENRCFNVIPNYIYECKRLVVLGVRMS